MKTVAAAFFLLFSFAAFSQQKVSIYNPKANAQAGLDAAIAKASAQKKHIFVQVGGNWCVWCIAFHKMIDENTELKKFLPDNYEVMLLNYSPENKNLPILAKMGYPQRFGFPVFVILNEKGKVIHIQDSSYLESSEKEANGSAKMAHDPKKVMAFLKQWTYKATDPDTYASQQ